MKTLFSVAGCMIAMMLMVPEVYGQRGLREDDVDVTVTDVKVIKQKITNDSFPEIRGIRESGRRDWAIIVVEYEFDADRNAKGTRDEGGLYVNEITFEWKVIVSDEERNGNLDQDDVVRLEKSVTYTDLRVEAADDRKKTAVIVVDARILARYVEGDFKEENIFYELRARSGRKTIEEVNGHGKDWTRSDNNRRELTPYSSGRENLMRSEEVTVRREGLLNRHESPFSFYGEDNLEMIRPDTGLNR